jgi:putative flippase GtrA
MDYSQPLLLVAISMMMGIMLANVFAYLEFRHNESVTNRNGVFKRLGITITFFLSVIFSLSVSWLFGIRGLNPDPFTLIGFGITVTKFIIIVSASILGYIWTFDSIKFLNRL